MAKQGTATVTPRLRFPEFRSAPGWSAKILGEEGEFLSTLTGKSAQDFGTGKAKYVTYMNVFSNTFTDMRSLGTVDVGSGESQNAIQPGDVLFTVSSETPEEVGMSSVVVEAAPNCYVNSFCAMFRFSEGRQPNLHFLGYSLRQPFARRHFVKRAQGSTRFNLSKPAFRSLPLALPVRSEQQKIADCLTSLDEVIAAQGRKVEALKAHKRGLMQQLFPREGETRPRLRFPEFRNASDWEDGRVGDTVPFVTSGSRGWAAYYADTGSLFVRITNLSRSSIFLDLSDSKFVALPPEATEGVRTQLKVDDVLISITADTGIVGYVDGSVPSPAYINQHIALVRFDGSKVLGRFAAYFLASEVSQRQFRGSTDSGAKAGMNLLAVQSMKLQLPALAEQHRIADCLTSVDTQITAESNQLAALKTHKQGLMQQLFPAPEATHA